ncbi:hypothetical protein [Deinococcus ruber]|uniref:Uncharacterized protein n=1 Tax=Deinococcus ruber TaxID=1848197 RepID=A0A918F8U2_9DEIO|nr:hypothetical protein [Deinococcus ruber]GGR16561.1 hypothetical protein GCM10008957_31510 [Deinococcus ruber]
MKTHLSISSVVAALLLAACGPTPTPTPSTQPTQTNTLGSLYEVNFQGVGDSAPIVKAQRLTSALHGQALIGAPEAQVGISTDPLSVSSFTNRVTNIRHIQATFRVTNNSSSTLDNLMFFPTVTADTDGDPTNNATPPTIAGTPFRAVEFFDGSDASSRATSLIPGHGQRLNPSSNVVTDDPDASPFLTGLDISAVVPVPPTGLSATVQNSGWQVSPSLAPGQSANVTFAVDEQNVDPANPKNDPYRFNLLVSAGQDDPALAATGSAINASSLRGTLSDRATFGGKLWFRSSLMSTSIGSAGQVDLPLTAVPAPSALNSILQSGCTYNGLISDTNGKFASYSRFSTLSAQGDPVAVTREKLVGGASMTDAYVARIYSDTPEVLKGTLTCGDGYTETYDMTLVVGWNAVELSATNTSTVFKTLASNARSVLTSTRNTPGVSAQLSDSSMITLHPGERVTRSLNVLQVGAYSGAVNVSTNIPGVTIEPSTLTLGELGAQAIRPMGLNGSIQPLSLGTQITFVAAADAPLFNPYSNPNTALLVLKDTQGKVLQQVPISAAVVAPGITAQFGYNYLTNTFGQGENASVPVMLNSMNNFSGPVTVTLGTLPAGMSAPTQTVQLTAGSSTTVDIPVSVSADAPLGTFTISLSTTPINVFPSDSGLHTDITIVPQRLNLGNVSFYARINPGGTGSWISGLTSQYTPTTFTTTLKRYSRNVLQTTALMTVPLSDTLGYVRNGNQLLTGIATGNTSSVRRDIHDDGTYTETTVPSSVDVDKTVIDAQNRLWFIRIDDYNQPNGGHLYRTNADGTVVNVPIALPLTINSSIHISNNGQFVGVFGQYDTPNIAVIDTASESVTLLPNPNVFTSFNSFAIANDGSVWLSQPHLRHIKPSGEIVNFNNITSEDMIGFDQQDPNTLWTHISANIIKVNVVTQDTQSVNIGYFNVNNMRFSLPAEGGLDILHTSWDSSVTYLTHLN